MRTFWTPTIVTGTLLLLVAVGDAQEWTRFRGPNGTGTSDATSIPVTWTEADYRWKTELPGKGHSSPVVWGDKLFLLSADSDDATRYVLGLNTLTGKILWRKDYPSSVHGMHTRNTYASSTPAVDKDRLYAAWATPDQLSLRAWDHDGNEIWVRDLGSWTSQHGFGTSPIVYKDLVILCNSQQGKELDPDQKPGQSQVMAFDRETGELRWTTPRTTTRVCYPTPCIYRPENGPPELIGYNTGDGFYSLDPETGKPNWSISVFKMRNVASPILVRNQVFGSNGSGGGGNYLVSVRIGDPPEEVYRVTRHAPYVSTPVARGDLVFLFFDRGFASCIQAADGKVVWSERLSRGFSGSPVLVGDKIYCIDDDGIVLVLAAERRFKVLARNRLGEKSRSTPAISGGRMFLRTESHLFCVGGDGA